jgi:class 3 adenylate cyclase
VTAGERFSKIYFNDLDQVIGMERVHLKRQLKAVLLADVVGYSRLMSVDEEGTHVKLADYVKNLIEPQIAEYDGRLIRSMGDGLLVEFNSAADAVCCGLDLQDSIAQRDGAADRDHQIRLRIGINTGDVITDDRDIYGNSVNIAARLEGLAEPGKIYVTRGVRDQLQGHPDLSFEDKGDRRVKNIERPIRVYSVTRAVDPQREATSQGLGPRSTAFPHAVWSAPAFGHSDGQYVGHSSRGYSGGAADPARLHADVPSRIDHGAAVPQFEQ